VKPKRYSALRTAISARRAKRPDGIAALYTAEQRLLRAPGSRGLRPSLGPSGFQTGTLHVRRVKNGTPSIGFLATRLRTTSVRDLADKMGLSAPSLYNA
jgi:hypothetical protein